MNLELREKLKDQCKYNFDDFQKAKILFPIILDKKGKEAFTKWVKNLNLENASIDFYEWKNREKYEKSFACLLRELQIEYPIANFDQN